MKLTTLFIITLICKDLLSHYFGQTVISFLLIFLLLGLVVSFVCKKKNIEKKYTILILVLGLIYLFKALLGGFNLIPYLLGPIIVFFIPADWLTKHKKILIIIALVNIVLMIYEVYTGNYIYELIGADGNVLDSKLFGGYDKIFRAKGIFAGPLSAVAFAYCVGLVYNFNKPTSIIIIIIGLLSLGRLSIFIGLFFFFYNSRNSKFIGFLVAITIVIVLNYYSGTIINFITSALDFKSSNNLSRFYHWGVALNLISDFSLLEFLTGSTSLVERSTSFESDLIRILYSTGVFGLIAYIYMIFKINEVSSFVIAVIISITMLIFPFVQSLPVIVLFSLVIKKAFYDKKYI